MPVVNLISQCFLVVLLIVFSSSCEQRRESPGSASTKSATEDQRWQQAADKVLSDEKLLDQIWDASYKSAHSTYAKVKALEKALEKHPIEKRVALMITQLHSKDQIERYIAEGQLSKIGPAATESLVEILKSNTRLQVKQHAARALGPTACKGLPALAQLYRENDKFSSLTAKQTIRKLLSCVPQSKPLQFKGRCPEKPGPKHQLPMLSMIAKYNSLNYIRVRKELVWEAQDLSNVLGNIPSGTLFWAGGPLKRSQEEGGSMGIGYRVKLEDPTGRRCVGYVSNTVVDLLQD